MTVEERRECLERAFGNSTESEYHELVQTSPVIQAIYNLAYDVRDNEIGRELGASRLPHNCKNNGHPWCKSSANCPVCDEWRFDVLAYCRRKDSGGQRN